MLSSLLWGVMSGVEHPPALGLQGFFPRDARGGNGEPGSWTAVRHPVSAVLNLLLCLG